VSTPIYDEARYQSQLELKIQKLQQDFANFNLDSIEVFTSPIQHFRMRAEFRVWHQGDQLNYIMFGQEDKKPYTITDFPIGSKTINELMPKLIDAICQQQQLKHKLYQIDFLTAQSGEALVTLIYHKHLDENWLTFANALKNQLKINIVGRSKGQRLLVDKDYIIETFKVGQEDFFYKHVEASFTQPNAAICQDMLNWAYNHSKGLGQDLLELYCGNGNFTLPLSKNFNKVMATEISKTSVDAALFNLEKNNIANIQIARMSSEEFVQALDGEREFFRLKDINLQDYQFSTIFVDPPRAGLDDKTVGITQRFDNIIYISCNPETLHQNLLTMTQTHKIKNFAVFDQFPYTHHLECGAILQKK
jgi:tRNA (uracil-5-)-methyltransferase